MVNDELKVQRSDRRRRKMTVIFRVTPEEYARLADVAANTEMGNVNAWARAVTFEAAGRPEMSRKDLRKIIGQLGKVGTNINQIAKIANTNGRVELEAELRAEREKLATLARLISIVLE